MTLIPALGQQRQWDFHEATLASITNFRKEKEGQPRCLAEQRKAQCCSSVRSYRLMTIFEVSRRFQSKKREEKNNLEKLPLNRRVENMPSKKKTALSQGNKCNSSI